MWLYMFFVGVILSMALGDLLWFLYYGMECSINGAYNPTESSLRMVWRCWQEERSWILPGGRKLKGEYIKKLMGSFENGHIGEWRYRDIRENNLYEEVGDAELPGLGHYILTHICLPSIPLCIYLLIVTCLYLSV